MKRSWTITIIICLLLLGGGAAVLLIPRVVPFDQCSDLYKHYSNVEGIDATFIKDFKVNDTVFVDVTLLETKDSAQWDILCKDFGIPTFFMYPKEYREIMMAEHSFGQQIIRDTVSTEPNCVIKKDLVVFSRINMSMYIFHNINDTQYDAIINKEYEEVTY